MSKKSILRGTLILTASGLAARVIGFFYRIFLSHSIGAQGMGIYQLVMPLQALTLSISASGIHTAISRLCASRFALGQKKEARNFFFLGSALSVLISCLLSLFIWRHAAFFAQEILKEPRTCPLIRLLAFSFPLSALHGCINSYYFAEKKAGIPSAVQLLEQTVRVSSCFLLYQIFLANNIKVTPMIAIGGSLAGEVASCLSGLLCLGSDFFSDGYSIRAVKNPAPALKEISRLAVPLSLNRLLLNLLGSIEVVLIPQMLRAFGMSSREALSVYGIFTGMAFPLILFPSALTNSVSVMLMPSVAQLQALGCRKKIDDVTSKTCLCCLGLGSLCTFFFLVFGELMGALLFKNTAVGAYIRALSFVCPFLYLDTTLSSILNGLGRAGACLIHNLLCICLRIAFVVLAIPSIGIRGYFYGLLFSQLLLSALHFFSLKRAPQ